MGTTSDELLTLEYSELKTEQRQRIATRDGLIYATLASIGAVIVGASKLASPLILLALPPAVGLLGWTYLANDRKITEIGRYIRDGLAPQLDAYGAGPTPFGWETRHLRTPNRRAHKIGQLAVDLSAFCLPPVAAAAVLCAQPHIPAWAVLLAVLELAVPAALAVMIVEGADLTRPRSLRPGDRETRAGLP
jgi:hypothetical protein